MRNKFKKITVAASTVLFGLTMVSCSLNGDNSESENSESNISSETSDNNASVENSVEQVSLVVNDFFTFINEPVDLPEGDFDSQGEPATNEEILSQYEEMYDLNEYVTYDDLSEKDKFSLYSVVMQGKFSSNVFGSDYLTYEIDDSKINIEGDTATLNGEGINMIIDLSVFGETSENGEPATETENFGSGTELKMVKTDEGWKIDANSALTFFGTNSESNLDDDFNNENSVEETPNELEYETDNDVTYQPPTFSQ